MIAGDAVVSRDDSSGDGPVVTQMRTAQIALPFPEPFGAGDWLLTTTHNAVVMLQTTTRHRGFGYAFAFDEGHGRALVAALEALEDVVVGSAVWDTEGLRGRLVRKANFTGTTGLSMSAIGAIDLAMWDLKGRISDQPVHALLGAGRRGTPAYASGGPHNKPLNLLEREVAGYLEDGYRALKVKIPPDPTVAIERIRCVTKWAGPNVSVMFDANQQLELKTALRIAEAATECGAYWLEEPFPYWDLRSHSELRDRAGIRLALGETLYGEHAFEDAINRRATDVVMVNLHKVGGITGWCRVKAIAESSGVGISSHIMPEVSAHVMPSAQPDQLLEYMTLSAGLYEEPPKPRNGVLFAAPGPGFGLEPSPAVKHALELDR